MERVKPAPVDQKDLIRRLKGRVMRAAASRRELQRRMFHLKTLYDLSREIGFLIDTQEIMRNLLMMSIGTFGALRGVIVLVDVNGHRLEAVSDRGLEEEGLLRLRQFVEAGGGRELTSLGGIQHLRQRGRIRAGKDRPFLQLLASLDLDLLIPFHVKDHLWGGLGLGERLSEDPYGKDDEELLTTLCNQGAVALKNATTHQEVVRYAAELEASLRRIQILENVKSNLAKFVPKTVQELIEESPEAPLFDKRELDVSVLFADISSYTRVSAELPLERVNRLVERYFGAFLDEILKRGGDVNETAGDGLMVIFRKRNPRRHARAAVLAALGIQRRTQEINTELEGELQPISMKVGVNSGIASVGATKIEGAAGMRWTYTASGPTTNIAARLAALGEGGGVVVSEETHHRLGDEFQADDLGFQALKNVRQPAHVYRVTGLRSASAAASPVDHRRHPRRPASWQVVVWVGDEVFVGNVADASRHGIRVTEIPPGILKVGESYRLSLRRGQDEVACSGEVRRIDDHGVGIETSQDLSAP
jgi:class 3 adenylate cyclase